MGHRKHRYRRQKKKSMKPDILLLILSGIIDLIVSAIVAWISSLFQ